MTAAEFRNEMQPDVASLPGREETLMASTEDGDDTELPAGIERIDLADPEFMAHAQERYAAMRATCPVSRVVIASSVSGIDAGPITDRPLWFVTGYEDGTRALLDREVTVDALSVMTPEHLARLPETPGEFKPLMRNILTVDPPEHTRLRKLVQPSFTASAIERLRPRIQQITDDLLDGIDDTAAARGERAPDRQMELIAQFSYPLPVIVICELLGIPPEDREQTRIWSERMLAPPTPERREEIRQSVGAFTSFLRRLFTCKRERPDDELIAQLLQAAVDGDHLTEDEVLAMVFILFTAGHVTTLNMMANGVFALLTHPEQAAQLRADPGLVPNALEEVLRYYGPAETTTARFAREEIELGGQAIAKGDPLLVGLAAANHDPARFGQPDVFDITRKDANRHIAFGKGVHACLGAPLARLEGQIALATLFRRYPNLRLAVPREAIRWAPSSLRGLTGLPLLF